MFLCCSARLRGYPVQVTDSSGYLHRQGRSFGGNRVAKQGLSSTFRRRSLSERNKTFTMIICTPLPALMVLLPLHLLLLIAEGVLLAALRHDTRIWGSIYAPVIPSIAEQRRNLLAVRKRIFSTPGVARSPYFRPFTAWPRKLALLIGHGLPTIR
jgi:hypothetical protein